MFGTNQRNSHNFWWLLDVDMNLLYSIKVELHTDIQKKTKMQWTISKPCYWSEIALVQGNWEI